MYKIIFYEDKKGRSSVRDYTNALAWRNDKESRIKFRKIKRDIELLIERGTRIGEPVVKHVSGEIWELRPLRDRILFAAWVGARSFCSILFKKKRKKPRAVKLKKPNANLRTSRRDSDEHDDKL